MNERLALYLDNVEKIRLYFGQGAEKFVLFDFEEVLKAIKAHSK